MIVKGIIDEDFVNYRVPSMVIECGYCNMKCGIQNCQNAHLLTAPDIVIDNVKLAERYINNPITKAVVLQGLDPLGNTESVNQTLEFINILRGYGCDDDVVIYTGFDKHEISDVVEFIKTYFKNIVVKFGRYKPELDARRDDILGVQLASSNQYAERIC